MFGTINKPYIRDKLYSLYIKISESENAKKLQLHPFFNRMIVK